MLFVRLIHQIRSDMLANGGIEDLFLDNRMNLQFLQSPGDEPGLLIAAFSFFELVEEVLDGIMIFLEDGDGMFLGQHPVEHGDPPQSGLRSLKVASNFGSNSVYGWERALDHLAQHG